MAPRTSWKGFIKLSLVSVPVRAFTANATGETIRLNQLHGECHSRVRYKKVCPAHGELSSDDIVSGYEYGKDQYVVIETDELAKLRATSDRAISLEGFVQADDIDATYHAGKTYYLLPDGVAGDKPYALLRAGMEERGLVALGWVVLSGREQLVLLRPRDELLVMSVLHVAKKIKPMEDFSSELGDAALTDDELSLTRTLIDASVIDDFDYGDYKDRYNEQLGELIQLKVDGKEIVEAPDLEEPKILNLMDALKKSVAAAQSSAAPKPAAKKPAAKKKAAAKKKTSKKKMAASKTKAKTTRKKKTG